MKHTCQLLGLLGLLVSSSASAIEFACEQAGDERYLRVNMPGEEHLCEVGVTYPGGSHRVMWYADNDTLYCSAKLYELRDKYTDELGFSCSAPDDRDGVDNLSARHRFILDTQLKSLILRGRGASPAFEVTGLKAVASNRLDDQPGALALQFFLAAARGEDTDNESASDPDTSNQISDADSVDAARDNVADRSDDTSFGHGRTLPADRDRTQVIIDEGDSWRVLSTVEDLRSQVEPVEGLTVSSAVIESVNDTGALQINTLLTENNSDGPAPCHGEQVIQWQSDGSLRPQNTASPCLYREPLMNIASKALGACLLAVLTCAQAQAAPENYKLDPTHTAVALLIGHVGFSKVLGRFTELEGSFTYDVDTGELNDVIVKVQSASFDSDHKARDEHVLGKDFLNAKQHPTLTFATEAPVQIAEGAGVVEGQFTMLGKTLPLTLQATLNKAGEYPFGHKKFTLGITIRGTIERSQYGMDYGVKNGLVSDRIELIIETEALQQ